MTSGASGPGGVTNIYCSIPIFNEGDAPQFFLPVLFYARESRQKIRKAGAQNSHFPGPKSSTPIFFVIRK